MTATFRYPSFQIPSTCSLVSVAYDARTLITQCRNGVYSVCAPVKSPTSGIFASSAIGRYFTAVGGLIKKNKVEQHPFLCPLKNTATLTRANACGKDPH